MKILYRLFDEHGVFCGEPIIRMDSFRVIKETSCGAWISLGYDRKKFVLLRHGCGGRTTKRWACETPEEALESFRFRKQRQAERLRAQLKQAEDALAHAMKPDFKPHTPTPIWSINSQKS